MSEPPFGADMPHEALPPAGWRTNNHTYDTSNPEPMNGEGLDGSTGFGGMPRVYAPPGFQQGSPWPAAPIPMPGTIHTAPDASMPPGWAPRASGATAQEASAHNRGTKMTKSPMLSAEFLNSPETHALIQHMGMFASLLLGQLFGGNPLADSNVAGNVPGAAPGMAGQLPDGSMPLSRTGYLADGHELDRYQAEQQQLIKAHEADGNNPETNIGEWQALNRINRTAQQDFTNMAKGQHNAPGAPVATAEPMGGNFEARNTKLKGEGGAARME